MSEMSEVEGLCENGAVINVFMKDDEDEWGEVHTEVVGVGEFLGLNKFFYCCTFPEDQHHTHLVRFDKVVKYHKQSYELRSKHQKVFVNKLEDTTDIKRFNLWLKAYREDKKAIDDFLNQEKKQWNGG